MLTNNDGIVILPIYSQSGASGIRIPNARSIILNFLSKTTFYPKKTLKTELKTFKYSSHNIRFKKGWRHQNLGVCGSLYSIFFVSVHLCLYARIKIQVYSIIVMSFRQNTVNFPSLKNTAKNTVISTNFLVLKYWRKTKFPHSLGKSPEAMQKLCLSTKSPQQEIRWNCNILISANYQHKSKPFLFFEVWFNLSDYEMLSFFLEVFYDLVCQTSFRGRPRPCLYPSHSKPVKITSLIWCLNPGWNI